MAKNNKVVEVLDLVKKYKKAEVAAVDGVSFSVNEGDFFSLLGPNGAGKTTTISILTTMLSRTSGVAKVAGWDVETESDKVRKNIGVIFQKPSLDDNLTAEENIRFHAVLYGMYPFAATFGWMDKGYKDKVYKLAEVLDIKDSLHKPIKTLSGGMKRKLEIVRSLMHEPKVLFLDEPTSGLDPVSRKNLWEYLKEVRKRQNTTVFLTTHYLEEAEGSDNICVINKGKVVAAGSPADVKKKFTKKFLILSSKNKSDLTNELVNLRVPFIDEGKIKVAVKGGEAQQIIAKLKTHLTDFELFNPSLEEAYIQIIKEGNETN